MSFVIELSGGRFQLDKSKAFCTLLKNSLPASSKLFTELIDEFDKTIRQLYSIRQESLNNAHGDWYEWFMALAAWNYYAKCLFRPSRPSVPVIPTTCRSVATLVVSILPLLVGLSQV